MNAIKPLAEDQDSVTLSRGDFEALLEALEDRIDLAAVHEQDAREAELGVEAARRDHLTGDSVRRLIAGESPVRVWRDHRGMSLDTLAEAMGISPSRLNDIETGAEPINADVLARAAQALELDPDDLDPILGI